MKLYLLIFMLLIGCSSVDLHRYPSHYQYNLDLAACDVIVSDLIRTKKRGTFMEKLGQYLFDFRSYYTERCLRNRGYAFQEDDWEEEEGSSREEMPD